MGARLESVTATVKGVTLLICEVGMAKKKRGYQRNGTGVDELWKYFDTLYFDYP